MIKDLYGMARRWNGGVLRNQRGLTFNVRIPDELPKRITFGEGD